MNKNPVYLMSMIIAIALFCHNPKTKRPVEWASCPLWNGHLARCGMGILPVPDSATRGEFNS
ncbi:hypothetical protein [Moorena sp. SIOASIH]|uniref:hypothetical protein n=1 Tax=Moorena sp. SIOASIH TaxID=2607817 RepID=UPI0025F5995C|nr:hypothetical protein [Moorena sp. SIOASIH]